MKIIIAPDSFKESLTALAVADAIERGFSEIFPDAEYIKLALADGGEGTVEVLLQSLSGSKRYADVQGPLGDNVNAMWAMLEANESGSKKSALIEVAAASGLDLVAPASRDALCSSTFGTGQLIKQALDEGAQKIILGLGGSATTDAGAGILQALGATLKKSDGSDISRGGLGLQALSEIDLSTLDPRCKEVELIVACDVDNPLCGDNGASHIFGPQKGADGAQVEQLDTALQHFMQLSCAAGHPNHQHSSGFGAAGGTPLGLSLAFPQQMKLQAGIEMVLDTLNIDHLLQGADLVITGEGQMDKQTLQGKAPFGIARRAGLQGIPSIAIAGSLGLEVEPLYDHLHAVFGTVRSPQALPQVLSEAQSNLTRSARNIAATLKLGGQLIK